MHHQIIQSNIIPVTENEKGFLGQAFKHHSSAQAAIKVLQEQLEYLDDLRKSTKENSILKEEKDWEQSTNELLSSTHRYLIESSGNKRNNSPLSSTVNCLNEKNKAYNKISQSISPIKSTSLLSELHSNESFASETLPFTPTSESYLIEEMSPLKNGANSIGKYVTPSLIDVTDLTGIIGRLVHGGATSGSDKSANASDELAAVLEKISCAGEVLQNELQQAKVREFTLLKQIQSLRSKMNGGSPQLQVSIGDGDVETKCKKLEDAMLSLQEENLKLNRLVKESQLPNHGRDELNETKRNLASNQSENKLLRATIDRMQAQIAYYEERHNKQNYIFQNSSESPIKGANEHGVKDHNAEMLKEKIEHLEKELDSARNASNDRENFDTTLSEMREKLLVKENYINQCEENLKMIRENNEELQRKYDDLQHSDVYKRKEVLQLCDKFERMKVKYLKLENEVLSLQKKEEQESVSYRSAEDFLKKFLLDNEILQKKLEAAEQRELARSKEILERDYDMLKSRYDDLLSRLGGLNTSASINPKKQVDFVAAEETNDRQITQNSISQHSMHAPVLDDLKSPKMKKRSVKAASESRQSNILHRRHHTTPGRTSAPSYDNRNSSPNFLRAKSASNVRTSISTPRPASCANAATSSRSPGSPATRSHSRLPVPRCSCGYVIQSPCPTEDNRVISGALGISDRSFNMEPSKNDAVKSDWPSIETSYRPRSSSDHLSLERKEKLPLLSKSDVLIGKSCLPQSRCNFDISSPNIKNRFNGETPYASEYLSNMDGVRLLVSLGNSENKFPVTQVESSALLNNSRLKTDSSVLRHKDTPHNDSSSPKASTLPDNRSLNFTASALPSLLTSVQYTESDLSRKFSTSSSEKSLHLSDLPCDETPVVDKFRNFDDYRGPPPVIDGGDISKPELSESARFPRDHRKESPKVHRHNEAFTRENRVKKQKNLFTKQLIESRLPENDNEHLKNLHDENDTVDQSSTSTTRDHVGRIEFLRNIQINSGMHLHGLMADTSITDAVRLNDSDLNGEVRLGLSNNQEAYADKLVKKYTKNAGKILDLA